MIYLQGINILLLILLFKTFPIKRNISRGWAITFIFKTFPFGKFTYDHFDVFYAIHKEDSVKKIHGFKGL